MSFECNEREILEAMKSKANALVLKAITHHAADTVRWSRSVLTDLWESEHMTRDEDSISDSSSTSSSSTTTTALGNIATYVNSLTGTNKESVAWPQKLSKRPSQSMDISKISRSESVTRKTVLGKEWVRTTSYAVKKFPM
jgi:hypothetical protein